MKGGKKTYIAMLLVACAVSQSRAAGYDDVALIVNARSSASRAIGAYFASARSIPPENILNVDIDTTEEITPAIFTDLRTQIEQSILANGINARLNYLVTTKGIPLKITYGDAGTTTSRSASVESELTCILGSHSGSIGGAGRLFSPVYNLARHFDRSRDSLLLVTRLDGYTVADVCDMIDRSGPGTHISASSVIVLDQDPNWNSTAPTLNAYLLDATTKLEAKGHTVALNQDTVFVTKASTVLGYVSWGSNDHYAADFTSFARPQNNWVAGALAETYVSTSGRTFDTPDRSGQSLIADLIAEGVSGAKGYVYEPFSSSMAVSSILFDRYFSGYTLAESYFMSSYYVSWMDVVIGDPKTTITIAAPVALPIQLSTFTALPLTAGPGVTIAWRTVSETNNYGFTVERSDARDGIYATIGLFVAGNGTTTIAHVYSIIDRTVESGTYFYRLRQYDLSGDVHVSEPCQVTLSGPTDVADHSMPDAPGLDQNFPNPFNPSTTISFRVAAAGRAVLDVFDVAGQKVTTLIDETMQAGPHAVTFRPDRLASGTYITRLTVGSRVWTNKMVYLK